MTNLIAERIQDEIDLRGQIADLSNEESQDIQFSVSSPGRVYVTLWSMLTGEEIRIPKYMAASALSKRQGGKRQFTAKREEAPAERKNSVKCFLHSESPERAILEEIGIFGDCIADSLANSHSKRMHAMHRHRQEWAAYQEHVNDQEKKRYEDRQERQLEATLALAGKAAGTKAVAETLTCDCGWETEKGENSLKAHKRLHCPLREGAA